MLPAFLCEYKTCQIKEFLVEFKRTVIAVRVLP